MKFAAASYAVAMTVWAVGACAPTTRTAEGDRTTASPVLRCAPKEDGANGLDTEWSAFARFIDTCTLTTASGATALRIVSVSAQRYYAGQPPGTATVSLPKALVLAPSGREIGRLPYSYPDDPPFALELSFSQWRGAQPQQIDILVRDPTVTGDHRLTPMRWNVQTGRYTDATEQ